MSICKTIKKKNAVDLSDLNNIMGALTGDKNFINPFIVMDKKTVLFDSVKTIANLLASFNKNILSPIVNTKQIYSSYKNSIDGFIKDCETYTNRPQCKLDEMIDDYIFVKEHPIIIKVLHMVKILNKYESYIIDKENLSARFIYETSSCSSINLFDFCDLDFKMLIEHDIPKQNVEKIKTYILYMFHIIYDAGMKIHKALTSPDIDPAEFSKTIISLTNSFKSQIPGCDRAFKKINNSVDKLTACIEQNYKTIVTTKDPSILVKSFLNDLVEDSLSEGGEGEDMICTFQLKKIINHFKNIASKSKFEAKKSSQLDMLFEKADEYFDLLQPESESESKKNN